MSQSQEHRERLRSPEGRIRWAAPFHEYESSPWTPEVFDALFALEVDESKNDIYRMIEEQGDRLVGDFTVSERVPRTGYMAPRCYEHEPEECSCALPARATWVVWAESEKAD